MTYLQNLFVLIILSFSLMGCSSDTASITIQHELGKGYFLQSATSDWQSDYFDYLSDTTFAAIAASKNNKFGAISRKGQEVVPFEYEFSEVYPHFIVAHDFPNLVELHAYISVFDHKGSKYFTKLLRTCTPMNEHLIYGDLNNQKAFILNPLGAVLHEALPHRVKEVLPGIFEFKNKSGELAYLNEKGDLIDRPKYVPLYKTYDEFKGSDYLVVTDAQEQKLLIDKQQNVIDLPKGGYEPLDVQYNYAILKRDTYYYEVYDIKNTEILDSTLSTEFIKIRLCDADAPKGKLFFSNVYRNRKYKYIGMDGGVAVTFDRGLPKTDGEPYILDICGDEIKRYDVNGSARLYSRKYNFFSGKGGENYFQDKENTKVYPTKDWTIKRSSGVTASDLYTIVKDREEQYGLINENFEVVVPLEYGDITKAGTFNNTFYTFIDGKQGMVDAQGNITIAAEYDELIPLWGYYKKHGIIIARKDRNYYLLNFSGTPYDDQIYTSYYRKHGNIYPVKYQLSNDQVAIGIDAVGRIKKR